MPAWQRVPAAGGAASQPAAALIGVASASSPGGAASSAKRESAGKTGAGSRAKWLLGTPFGAGYRMILHAYRHPSGDLAAEDLRAFLGASVEESFAGSFVRFGTALGDAASRKPSAMASSRGAPGSNVLAALQKVWGHALLRVAVSELVSVASEVIVALSLGWALYDLEDGYLEGPAWLPHANASRVGSAGAHAGALVVASLVAAFARHSAAHRRAQVVAAAGAVLRSTVFRRRACCEAPTESELLALTAPLPGLAIAWVEGSRLRVATQLAGALLAQWAVVHALGFAGLLAAPVALCGLGLDAGVRRAYAARWRDAATAAKARREEVSAELVDAMSLVKACAWERLYFRRLSVLRSEEREALARPARGAAWAAAARLDLLVLAQGAACVSLCIALSGLDSLGEGFRLWQVFQAWVAFRVLASQLRGLLHARFSHDPRRASADAALLEAAALGAFAPPLRAPPEQGDSAKYKASKQAVSVEGMRFFWAAVAATGKKPKGALLPPPPPPQAAEQGKDQKESKQRQRQATAPGSVWGPSAKASGICSTVNPADFFDVGEGPAGPPPIEEETSQASSEDFQAPAASPVRAVAAQSGAGAGPTGWDLVDQVTDDGSVAERAARAAKGRAEFDLRVLSLYVKRGALVALVGATGCGKSTLLAALRGACRQETWGDDAEGIGISLSGRLAFVPQRPMLLRQRSIRENVLCGLPFDASRYERALSMSTLGEDISVLPGADSCDVADLPALSGGPMALQLARALYRDAEIMLVDDPFVDMDPQRASRVLSRCLKKLGKERTVLLVTQNLSLLSGFPLIVVLRNGTIFEQGDYKTLTSMPSEFSRMLLISNKKDAARGLARQRRSGAGAPCPFLFYEVAADPLEEAFPLDREYEEMGLTLAKDDKFQSHDAGGQELWTSHRVSVSAAEPWISTKASGMQGAAAWNVSGGGVAVRDGIFTTVESVGATPRPGGTSARGDGGGLSARSASGGGGGLSARSGGGGGGLSARSSGVGLRVNNAGAAATSARGEPRNELERRGGVQERRRGFVVEAADAEDIADYFDSRGLSDKPLFGAPGAGQRFREDFTAQFEQQEPLLQPRMTPAPPTMAMEDDERDEPPGDLEASWQDWSGGGDGGAVGRNRLGLVQEVESADRPLVGRAKSQGRPQAREVEGVKDAKEDESHGTGGTSAASRPAAPLAPPPAGGLVETAALASARFGGAGGFAAWLFMKGGGLGSLLLACLVLGSVGAQLGMQYTLGSLVAPSRRMFAPTSAPVVSGTTSLPDLEASTTAQASGGVVDGDGVIWRGFGDDTSSTPIPATTTTVATTSAATATTTHAAVLSTAWVLNETNVFCSEATSASDSPGDAFECGATGCHLAEPVVLSVCEQTCIDLALWGCRYASWGGPDAAERWCYVLRTCAKNWTLPRYRTSQLSVAIADGARRRLFVGVLAESGDGSGSSASIVEDTGVQAFLPFLVLILLLAAVLLAVAQAQLGALVGLAAAQEASIRQLRAMLATSPTSLSDAAFLRERLLDDVADVDQYLPSHLPQILSAAVHLLAAVAAVAIVGVQQAVLAVGLTLAIGLAAYLHMLRLPLLRQLRRFASEAERQATLNAAHVAECHGLLVAHGQLLGFADGYDALCRDAARAAVGRDLADRWLCTRILLLVALLQGLIAFSALSQAEGSSIGEIGFVPIAVALLQVALLPEPLIVVLKHGAAMHIGTGALQRMRRLWRSLPAEELDSPALRMAAPTARELRECEEGRAALLRARHGGRVVIGDSVLDRGSELERAAALYDLARLEREQGISVEGFPLEEVADDWPNFGAVNFEKVSVNYGVGAAPALRGVSLRLPAASSLLILGPERSGKTTLVRALLRLAPIESGSISVDCVDVRSVGLTTLRSRVAVVPQDIVIFKGTWRANLDPMGEFEDEQILLAAKLTRLQNWLMRKAPRGLDELVPSDRTALGPELLTLLGASRAMLRLLQRRSKLLVMDGCTCRLDADSDATLTALLLRYSRRREVAVIQSSRRVNQVALYDNVAVLSSGYVAEHGPARRLWAKDGALRALAREQGVDSASLTKAEAVTDRLTSVWSWDVSPQEDPAWSDEFAVSIRTAKSRRR